MAPPLQKKTCAAGTAGAPTATPTPTPTSSSTSSSGASDGRSSTGTSVCPTPNYIAPIVIESSRVDADSISLNWGPYSGTDKFIVQYGFENGKWLYSTNVTGFSTTINGLPSNQPIWVRIASRDNCSVGNYGSSKLIGGPSLPNTGLGQTEKSFPWNFLIGIFLISSSLYLIQRKHKFS